jgi:ubiquinone/menaquinone biosynthesis C-methylase UbiE
MPGNVCSRDAWDKEFSRRGRRFGRFSPEVPPLFPGAIVLEAGCGDGRGLFAMADRSWQILALDFSIEAIKICMKSPPIKDIPYLVADSGMLPFRENSFDAIFLIHVAGHSQRSDRTAIASEMTRILKKGGNLFFRDFSLEDFRAGSGALIEEGTWKKGDGIITHYFTLQEVRHLFSHLTPSSLHEVEWFQRVRKKALRRVEIVAEFRKEQAYAGNHAGTKSAVLISCPSN